MSTLIRITVKCGHHPRQSDDFRTGAQNGYDLHAFSSEQVLALIIMIDREIVGVWVIRINISLDQNSVTISPEPTLVIECANPGGISIT